jgi:hypothetical protein
MTKLVEQAVAAIRKLPAETQDDLERVPPETMQQFWRAHGL